MNRLSFRHRAFRAALCAPIAAGMLASCSMKDFAENSYSSKETSSAVAKQSEDNVQNADPQPSVPKAKDAFAKLQKTAGGYTSIRCEGVDTVSGRDTRMTMIGNIDGNPVEASVTSKKGSKDGNFTLRAVGGKTFIKGDAAYWSSAGATALDTKRYTDQWVVMPAGTYTKKDIQTFTMKSVFDGMANDTRGAWSTMTSNDATSSTENVADEKTYKLVGDDGRTTVWVTADGNYNLVKFSGVAVPDNDFDEVTCSRWNDAGAIKAPKKYFRMTSK